MSDSSDDDQAAIADLTAKAFAAMESGDKLGADRLFAERNVVATKGANDLGTAAGAAARLSAQGLPAGEALVASWGGADASSFRENVGLALAAADDMAKVDPRIKDYFNTVRDGRSPGDDPAFLKVAVEWARTKGLRPKRISEATSNESSQSSIEGVLSEIDRLNRETPPGSGGYTDPRHQERLQQLFATAYGGGQPVVGAGLRRL